MIDVAETKKHKKVKFISKLTKNLVVRKTTGIFTLRQRQKV